MLKSQAEGGDGGFQSPPNFPSSSSSLMQQQQPEGFGTISNYHQLQPAHFSSSTPLQEMTALVRENQQQQQQLVTASSSSAEQQQQPVMDKETIQFAQRRLGQLIEQLDQLKQGIQEEPMPPPSSKPSFATNLATSQSTANAAAASECPDAMVSAAFSFSSFVLIN